MSDSLPDSCTHLVVCFATVQDRLAIDADLVRRNETVVVGAFCEWDTMIKTKEVHWIIHAREIKRLIIRAFFDYNCYIRDVSAQFLWQFVQYPLDLIIKVNAAHTGTIIP
jgi:hypothetical protein